MILVCLYGGKGYGYFAYPYPVKQLIENFD